ncbi:MAG: hypothetical protein QOE56_2505 [Solirubrobacterales bacterium]|jgi:hypothetical protein|nr:hypothetical protein [Solirubrobacterales bacterium]
MSASPLPSVSVLAFAPDSLASAEAQDYADLELVRLDGDGALGEGLDRAGGELVVHLRSGDTLLPGAVARLAAALAARPGTALVYPAFHLLDADGERAATEVPEEFGFAEMLMFQYSPVGPGAMFRRDLGLQAAAAAPGHPPAAEFEFWLRLAELGGSCRLIEALAARRPRAEADDRNPVESARERLGTLERILAAEPAADEAQLRSAARSACVLAALEFEDGLNAPQERFYIADRFAEADPAGLDNDAEIALLEARIVNLEQRLSRHRAVLPLLAATVDAREQRLAAGVGGHGRSLRGVARRLAGGGDAR